MKFASVLSFAVMFCCLSLTVAADEKAEKARSDLQGVWQPKSIKANGVDVPQEAVAKTRFTFQKTKLLIRGNFGDEREDTCKYKIDVTKSPRHFEFTPPGKDKPIQGIYQLKDGELRICVSRTNSGGKRPSEFKSDPDSGMILFIMRKAKEPKQ